MMLYAERRGLVLLMRGRCCSRDKRRVGRREYEGWDGERTMRMLLNVDRIARSMCVGGDEVTDFAGKEKQGRWKMDKALSSWPIPWLMIPSRYCIRRSNSSGLLGIRAASSSSCLKCSWPCFQTVRVQRAKTRCSWKKHFNVCRQLYREATLEIGWRAESVFTAFSTHHQLVIH